MVSVRRSASSSIQPTISTSRVSHCWTTAATRPALSRLSRAATSGSRAVGRSRGGRTCHGGHCSRSGAGDPDSESLVESRSGRILAKIGGRRLRSPGDPQQPGIESGPLGGTMTTDPFRPAGALSRRGFLDAAAAGRGRAAGDGGHPPLPRRRRSRRRSRPLLACRPAPRSSRSSPVVGRGSSACSCPAWCATARSAWLSPSTRVVAPAAAATTRRSSPRSGRRTSRPRCS